MGGNFDIQELILRISVLIIAITIHEFAHAITADRLGDPTPRKEGRISIFPVDHLDPLGTIMMILSSIAGFGIGWGKPVMTNPSYFKHPKRDSGLVAIAGPISNILQALVFAVLLFALGITQGSVFSQFLLYGLIINLSLAFFNMIPILPLDGHWVMNSLLPRDQANAYMNWNRSYGGMVFLGLILFENQLHVISTVVGPPVGYFVELVLSNVSVRGAALLGG